MGDGLLELLLEDTHSNKGGFTACGTMANGSVGGLLEGGHLLHKQFQEGLQVDLAWSTLSWSLVLYTKASCAKSPICLERFFNLLWVCL